MLGNLTGYGSDDSDNEQQQQNANGSTSHQSAHVSASQKASTSTSADKSHASHARAAAIGIKRPAPSPKPANSPHPEPEASTSRSRLASPVATSASEARPSSVPRESASARDPQQTDMAWPFDPYGLAPPDPSIKPSQALQDKLAHFHRLSAQGLSFNSTLERNKSFRNPHILDTLVRFVDVDETCSNLPAEEAWDASVMQSEGNVKRVGEKQKQREQDREERQTRGPRRDKIGFESSSGRRRSRSPPHSKYRR